MSFGVWENVGRVTILDVKIVEPVHIYLAISVTQKNLELFILLGFI
jgi:hypothetical protein